MSAKRAMQAADVGQEGQAGQDGHQASFTRMPLVSVA